MSGVSPAEVGRAEFQLLGFVQLVTQRIQGVAAVVQSSDSDIARCQRLEFACSQNWVFITKLHIHTMRGNAHKPT